MSGVEGAALAVGKAVAQKVVQTWLAYRADSTDRGKNLNELIRVSFTDRIHRRRIERQIEDIADGVFQRLQPFFEVEHTNLPENEQQAALLATADAIAAVDLSDEALFAADANPIKLVRHFSLDVKNMAKNFMLSESASQLFNRLVVECVTDYVYLVVSLKEFIPRASQEILTRLSDIGGELCRVMDRMPIRTLYSAAGDDFDNEFRAEYLNIISNTLDELQFFGVNFENRAPRTTLSVAYVSLSVFRGDEQNEERQSRESGHIGPFNLLVEQDSQRLSTIQVESALAGSERMLIRGEAGSGKSTLLNWLAVTAARGGFRGGLSKLNGSTPFLIKLRSFAGRSFPLTGQFIDEVAPALSGHMPDGWVDRQLRSGRGLLLIDGVDELTDSQRRQAKKWLRGLITAYQSARVVVTSRPAAAGSDWLIAEQFSSATLARMTPADVRLFIAQWHEAARDADSLPRHVSSISEYESSLVARLESNQHLLSLAQTPLLCAMLCALNVDQQKFLPRNRMSLYEAGIKLLLRRRDEFRDIPSYISSLYLEEDAKLDILQNLAWRLTSYNKSEAARRDVVSWVERRLADMPTVTASPDEVFEHLLQRGGILRQPREQKIDFVHRTFQEYLASAHIAGNDDIDLLASKAHLKLWREIVVMTAGHAIEPLRKKLIEKLVERINNEPRNRRILRLLLVSCLETMTTVPTEALSAIDESMQHLIPPRGMQEVRSLSSAGEHVLRRLPPTIKELSLPAAAATVATAAAINGRYALDVLENYASDDRQEVVTELISAWRYFDTVDYARRVLSKSPLIDGSLSINDQTLLAGVKYLSKLTELNLQLAGLKDPKILAELPALASLHVGDPELDFDMSLMSKHSKLRTLNLMCHCIAGISQLPEYCPNLEMLNLEVTESFSTELSWLESLLSLVDLSLQSVIETKDFSPLRKLEKLQYLRMRKCHRLTSLSQIGPLPQLNSLLLSAASLTDGLASINSLFPNLNYLSFWYMSGLVDLAPLAKLPMLERVDLEGCAEVVDLVSLSGVSRLYLLDIRACPNVQDLASLKLAKNLSELYLNGIPTELDLTPLADHDGLEINIDPEQVVRGEDKLGRGVKLIRRQVPFFSEDMPPKID